MTAGSNSLRALGLQGRCNNVQQVVLLNLAKDDFNEQAGDGSGTVQEIAQVAPRIKKVVDIQQAGKYAAQRLEPFPQAQKQ